MKKSYKIENLDHLLRDSIGSKTTLKEYSTKSLIPLGENYGSLVLALEIKLDQNGLPNQKAHPHHHHNGLKTDDDTDTTNLCMVAKLCPPNEYLKQVFDSSVTFKKEIASYKTIFPLLRSFKKTQGATFAFDFLPECYGARLSLKPNSTTVDDDAVLLLENLKLKDYQVVDRMRGFDLQTARLILKDLAVFHAVPLGLKLLMPDVFEREVLPHLTRNTVFDKISEEAAEAAANLVIDTVKDDERCRSIIPSIRKALKEQLKSFRNPPSALEPLATISHNDVWVNNIMLKFENSVAVANKMIDFQLMDYGSPANDVLFFIMSSVQMDVIDGHYNDLVRLYFDTLIETLKELKCNEPSITLERFLSEIDICAKTSKFFHVVIMLKHILAVRGTFKELSDVTEEDLVKASAISEEYKKKIVHTVLYFAKNNWI